MNRDIQSSETAETSQAWKGGDISAVCWPINVTSSTKKEPRKKQTLLLWKSVNKSQIQSLVISGRSYKQLFVQGRHITSEMPYYPLAHPLPHPLFCRHCSSPPDKRRLLTCSPVLSTLNSPPPPTSSLLQPPPSLPNLALGMRTRLSASHLTRSSHGLLTQFPPASQGSLRSPVQKAAARKRARDRSRLE